MKIKDIINEEFEKILKEGYMMEHDNFKFHQQIEPSMINFYNYEIFSNDFDVNIIKNEIFVNWRIGFWLNSVGVENFLVQVDNVEGIYKIELRDKQSDEVTQKNDKNINEVPWKFQIYDAKLKLRDSLYIKSLDFDFETKICNVTFFDSDNQI